MSNSSAPSKSISVLFVCMGNICRSPTAQGVFEKLAAESDLPINFKIDSAGTHAYHQGQAPDRRAQAALERFNIDISQQRARRVVDEDFHTFDFIFAMDKDNLLQLKSQAMRSGQAKVSLLMDFAPSGSLAEVPDPYYGGQSGFTEVIKLTEVACRGFLEHLVMAHTSLS